MIGSGRNLQIRTAGTASPVIPEEDLAGALAGIMERSRIKLSKSWGYGFLLSLSVALALMEPILVGFSRTDSTIWLQVAVLAVSCAFALLNLFVWYRQASIENDIGEVRSLEIVVKLLSPDVVFEVACIGFGWATLFITPGLAALRCVRVFRCLWYLNIYREVQTGKQHLNDDRSDTQNSTYFNNIDFEVYFFGVLRALQLCRYFLERLAIEIFTVHSRGGLVLLAMYFYISYLFAVVFWLEEPHFEASTFSSGSNDCQTLNNCFITMLRLACYDTVGWDYLQGLMNAGRRGYAFLLILYVIVATIFLLNGLVGIFSKVFALGEDVRGHLSYGRDGFQETVDSTSKQTKHNNMNNRVASPRSPTGFQTNHYHGSKNQQSHRISNKLLGERGLGGSAALEVSSDTDPSVQDPQYLLHTLDALRWEVSSLNGKITHIYELLQLQHQQVERGSGHSTPLSHISGSNGIGVVGNVSDNGTIMNSSYHHNVYSSSTKPVKRKNSNINNVKETAAVTTLLREGDFAPPGRVLSRGFTGRAFLPHPSSTSVVEGDDGEEEEVGGGSRKVVEIKN